MKTYTCKLLTNRTPLYFYALYDGSTRLTDAEMDTLFGTAGSAKFRFDFDGANPANVNKTVLYILKNDNITTKIYKQNVAIAGNGIIREGVPFLGTWQNSVTFYTFDFDFGKVLTDDQLSFLMHQIKNAGGSGGGTIFYLADNPFNDPSNICLYKDAEFTQAITGAEFCQAARSGSPVVLAYFEENMEHPGLGKYYYAHLVDLTIPNEDTIDAYDYSGGPAAYGSYGMIYFTLYFLSADPSATQAFSISGFN